MSTSTFTDVHMGVYCNLQCVVVLVLYYYNYENFQIALFLQVAVVTPGQALTLLALSVGMQSVTL